MTQWRQLLANKKVLIVDGAWGTELAKRGLGPGECPEKWNMDRPDDVRAVASEYAQAGADIVLTNTFGGNPFKLAEAGLEKNTESVNHRGTELSKDAAGKQALVFASIGPTGQFMKPLGSVGEKEMVKAFARQVRGFVAGGADGVVIETMTDTGEAIAAIKAVKDHSDLPVAASMTFDKGAKGYATMMGVEPNRAAEALTRAGADIVGSNCGAGPDNMIEIIALMKPETSLPLWAKPNAGIPELIEGKTCFRLGPKAFADDFHKLVAAGAKLIGGCCGTTPEHIQALAEKRESL